MFEGYAYMEKQQTTRWFLGANSAEGFRSLYEDFCRGEGDFLRIIKGGPGCGKSSFMRHIGEAAEKKGLEVEYILCSGDPDSLDGVYIPALRLGYADGTAPHIRPGCRCALPGTRSYSTGPKRSCTARRGRRSRSQFRSPQ